MRDSYDLIVVGGGAAGLTAASYAGRLGLKVALIEKGRLGGDCTWHACVPSKALLKVAKVAHTARTAEQYGIRTGEPEVDMQRVRSYVQDAVANIYEHETPDEIAKRGVDVIIGQARFVDAHTVVVDDRRLHGKRFILATGARPVLPPIDGLAEVSYFTYETLFDNDRVPEHLIVIGAGPVGVEMAQAYAWLGARVTLVDEHLLPNEEPEAAEVMQRVLARDSVSFEQGLVGAVSQAGDTIMARLKNGREVRGGMLLVATGRAPTVDTMGLGRAGVAFTSAGIAVDDTLRTNVNHIFAAGDCTGRPQFTHYAGVQGATAARNALFPGRSVLKDELLPRVSFTEPEVAQVGLTEAQARAKHGDAVKVFVWPLAQGDRAVIEDDTDGFVKLVYKGRGSLLGATIVAARAGEMITEVTVALKRGISLSQLVGVMHPYPAYTEIVSKAAGQLLIAELFRGWTGRVVRAAARLIT